VSEIKVVEEERKNIGERERKRKIGP